MKILLPVDGSNESLDAVRHALQLVRRRAARRPGAGQRAGAGQPLRAAAPARRRGDRERDACRAGAHSLEEANALCAAAGVPCEQELETGDPAQMLHDIAELPGLRAGGSWVRAARAAHAARGSARSRTRCCTTRPCRSRSSARTRRRRCAKWAKWTRWIRPEAAEPRRRA